MATYNFPAASASQAFTTSDTLLFDDTIDAGSLTIAQVGVNVTITKGAVIYTLLNFDISKIGTSKFVFANGSQMIVGDGATSTTADANNNVLVASEFADYLDGRGQSSATGSVGDTLSYATASAGVSVNLTTSAVDGAATGDKILSIESLIGSIFNDTLTGTASGNSLNGGLGIDTLDGGAGNDTYTITPGDTVIDSAGTADLIIADYDYILAADIENLTLKGTAIYGIGNAAVNTITGTTGNNVLDGGGAADTLIGLAGNDTYIVADSGVVITEAASAGTDIVWSSVDYTLTDTDVENLRLMGTTAIDGTGNSANNIIYANSGANTLDGAAGTKDTLSYQFGATAGVTVSLALGTATGGSGSDTISGFENLVGSNYADSLTGKSGVNELTGGRGNDSYFVDGLDVVFESSNQGTDLITASVNYSLNTPALANVENLTLTGASADTATGNGLNNVLTGGGVAGTTLIGNGGNDTLIGGAGAGKTLIGGAGNDTYTVTVATDAIDEAASAGTDLVSANLTFDLTTQDNVENLTLTGATAIDATGNALANVLTGNTGNNVLTGAAGNDTLIGDAGTDRLDGGTGNDKMTGGTGNDTYVVNATTDTVTEASGADVDLVEASISYTLGANVENLTLTGASAINGTGNGTTAAPISNTLTGNTGANTLDGKGGADTMAGGDGSDIYIVDNTGDTVTEGASTGTDTVKSSVTYTISDTAVENLTLTGSTAIDGTGNSSANTLTGNSAANTLSGGGAVDKLFGGAGNDNLNGQAGADELTGNAGVDFFIFSSATEAAGDLIKDFTQGTDKIDFQFLAGGSFIGSDAFSSVPKQVRFEPAGSDTTVEVDVNGDGDAVDAGDFTITVTGLIALVEADFVF